MALVLQATSRELIERMVAEFVSGVVSTVPNLVAGLVFLAVALFAIRIVRRLARSVLDRLYPDEQMLVVDLAELLVGVFLWFGALLTLLKIVGLGDIAASLGTATGFVALGVSYALSDMIADTVAGVYLLRDPDFNVGDTVVTGSYTGTVLDIGLRKSRLDVDGDTVVLANRSVESQWTRVDEDPTTS
jgi:small-conductance mechanosensitive channel